MAKLQDMRLNIIIIACMTLLGFASPQFEFWNLNALSYRLIFEIRHEFSHCPCKAERQLGLESLQKYQSVGKTSAQVIQMLGTPDRVRGLFPDRNGHDVEEIPKDMWSYDRLKLVLCISKNKCIEAFPMHTYFH